MKKIAAVLLAIVLLLGTWMVIIKINLKPIDNRLVSFLNDEVQVIDFAEAKVEYFSLNDYTKLHPDHTYVLKQETDQSCKIIMAKNGEQTICIETKNPIEEAPVLIKNQIYFVQSEEDGNAYLWRLEEGTAKKYDEFLLDQGSQIISDGENLIFVIKENDNYQIVKMDIETEGVELIAKGRRPCYMRDKDQLLFTKKEGYYSSNLMIKDEKLQKEEVLLSNQRIVASPVYDSKNQVILFWRDDPDASGAGMPSVASLYYLQENRWETVETYFQKRMLRLKVNHLLNTPYQSFWEDET